MIFTIRRTLFIILWLFPLLLTAQDPDSTWIVTHYVKKEQMIPMRDGVKLFTAVYMPVDSTSHSHPVLLLRTPYSCAPYGAAWIPFWKVYVKAYLKEGYVVVFQDVRGRYMSEGDFVNIRPFIPNKKTNKDVDEASDTFDTIEWLLKNIAGNNGKVGALGTSYGGFYTTMAGLSRHPALKAISPQAPVTDWFAGDDMHHNGAFMLMDMFSFFVKSGFGVERPNPTKNSPESLTDSATDAYDYYLRMGPLPNFAKVAAERKVPFWNEAVQHINYDQWWTARNPRNYADRILNGTASLVVGGSFDAEDCFGAINLYQAIEKDAKNNNKFVYGPWRHGQWGSADGTKLGCIQFDSNTSEWFVQHLELPFFNHYLKNTSSPDSITEATVFFTGENQWHQLKQWPPVNVRSTAFYLQKDGKVSLERPRGNNSEKYVSDPATPVPYMAGKQKDRPSEYMVDDQRFAANRSDVLTFQTETLEKDIVLAGPLRADLMVSLSTTDADFVVKLIDVFPEDYKDTCADDKSMSGYQMLVRGDVMRGKFRNSLGKPEPFTPGRITRVAYKLNDVAHRFKKGHRLMIQVQSSWFPIVDRNPQQFVDIYHAKDADFIKSTIQIYTSENAASKIFLPIVAGE